MRFLFVCCLFCFACKAQRGTAIQLDQVGFYPAGVKIAVVTGDAQALDFYVIDANKKDTVFRGRLGDARQSAYSSTITRLADFTSLKKQGRYIVTVPGIESSFPFEIRDQVYRDVSIAALKSYYFMRSDMALLPQYAGKWQRPAGHPDTEVLVHPSAASTERPAGTMISTPGGWYDAGDYNKYIVNSGITMGTLLSAYEDFSAYFDKLNTSIPESQDAIPDILNEVIYNLRWMLSMQDPHDGGVYHKCTNAAFDGMVMPGVTKASRYVVQKSTAAALDFAAVTAQASRILKKYNKWLPGLADSCLNASAAAWQWAMKNPAVLYSQRDINPKFDPDITTGEYGDRRLNDEWLWAAAELFVTTGNKTYYDVVAEQIKDTVSVPAWNSVGMMAYYTIARSSKSFRGYASPLAAQMKDSIVSFANKLTLNMAHNAFSTVMGQSRRDFIWGSNAVAANQGMLLINAFCIDPKKIYLDGALSNLDYILGRNATGYCFVTGIGSKSPMHPHHRPSEADGITGPVPGLLAGGPNPGRQDRCDYLFTEPETAYVDNVCSYASNEIAINWNAPLVYLLSAAEALMRN
jgi:endoglucanase